MPVTEIVTAKEPCGDVDDCPHCGGMVQVEGRTDLLYDGDVGICDSCGRGWYISVEEDDVWINNEQEPARPKRRRVPKGPR